MSHKLSKEKVYSNINMETDENDLEWIQVEASHEIAMYVIHKQGDDDTYDVGIEMSPDGIVSGGFHMKDMSVVTAGADGHIHTDHAGSMMYVRPRVFTTQPTSSPEAQADIYLQAFKSI